jgi:hypothetical protein
MSGVLSYRETILGPCLRLGARNLADPGPAADSALSQD